MYNAFLKAALDNDRVRARAVLRERLESGHSVSQTLRDVLMPALTTVGDLWASGEIDIAREHLVTNIATDCLEMLRESVTPNPSLTERAVVSCVEGERHEIGARMVADLLSLDGWSVDFLGANTPLEAVVHYARDVSPRLVGLSASRLADPELVRTTATALRALDPAPLVMIGGSILAVLDGPIEGVEFVDGDAVDAVVEARRLLSRSYRFGTLDDYLSALGSRIQSHRKARGWSQQVLANNAGLDRTYISAVEHGRQNLTLGAVYKLATALDLGLENLLIRDANNQAFRALP